MAIDFETWYRAEYPRLVNTLALVVGDRALAHDAAAEACTRALARWRRVSNMERPGGWIYRVALNDARRRARRSSRERRLAVDGAIPVVPDSPAVHTDVDLWAAVARLPERTREAVVLRYVADLTEPEIARALRISRGTVATMLRRARLRLAEELGPTAPEPTREYVDVHTG